MTNEMEQENAEQQVAIVKLNRDLRKAAETLSKDEARFLVDAYYLAQENRIREDAQIRELRKSGEPSEVILWLSSQSAVLEGQIKAALDKYSAKQPIGIWARGVVGIGPVIAAGLHAHIDINEAVTVSQIWRFAGLDPTVRWEKKTKRPWNAGLKTLCWKIGQSFLKLHNHPDCAYGRIYVERKQLEIHRNEAGLNRELAAKILTERNYGKTTEAFKHLSGGKLPPAHIDARARRYAVKMFLSHFHAKWRELEGLPVPVPYAIAHLNHAHEKKPD